jgi:hypothetical protein
MGAAGKPEAKLAKEPGRTKPRLKLDKDAIAQWARAGSPVSEIAQRLGVSQRTLERRMEEPEYRDLLSQAEAELKISLRTKQVEVALEGNVPMLIWLGKQMLGQKEKLEHSDDGARQGVRFAGTMDQLLALYHQLTTEVQPAVIDVEPQRTLGHGNGHAGA